MIILSEEELMNKLSIIIVALLFITAIWGQYELRESYYGSGGPVGATGGGYELWGSATGQTAATTVSGGTYSDQQGFYHGEKMFYVRFFAKDVQRAANNDADSIKLWDDSLKIGLHYLNRGVWKDTVIGPDDWSIYLWVDTVQASEKNYWYDSIATFTSAASPCGPRETCDPNFHRWARGDTAEGIVISGTQTVPESVTVKFWEEYRCSVYVEFDPPDGSVGAYDGGKVDFVNYRQFGTGETDNDIYEHNDNYDAWCDAGNGSYGSKLEFSDTTTAGWITIDDHVFGESGGLDKSITKTITYQKPYNAAYAQTVLWRRYTLFGVPLYPREDTTAYKNFAELHGCCAAGGFDGIVDYGEQDIVLYDDFPTSCAGSDSNCGTWENWYRVMRYYPNVGVGGYKRYQGPGDINNPDRFALGLGFWGNQTHCDSIPFDVYGVMADTTDSFEVALYQYDGTNAYTQYNMMANPFFKPDHDPIQPGDTIKVDVSEWRIKNVTLGGPSIPISEAADVSHGWIGGAIQVYRKIAGTWQYVPLAVNVFDADKYIYEWEGFWIIQYTTDELHLIMYTDRAAPALLARAPAAERWSVRLSCDMGDEGDYFNDAGFYSNSEMKILEPTDIMNPPDVPNPFRLYYIHDGKNYETYMTNERRDVYMWQVMLDPGGKIGKDARLFWNLENIPSEYAVLLKITGYDEVNLRTQNEVILQNVQKPIDMELFVYPVTSQVTSNNGLTPGDFFLSNVVPNPFNATATIKFGIPSGHGDFVTVEIVDISGHKVKTLWDESASAGYHTVVWDGTDKYGKTVSAGTYFCRIIHPEFTATKRAILVK